MHFNQVPNWSSGVRSQRIGRITRYGAFRVPHRSFHYSTISRFRRSSDLSGHDRARKRSVDRPICCACLRHVGHRGLGIQANPFCGRLLCGRRRYHRSAKRSSYGWGLHICGFFSRDFRPGLPHRFWRPDLFCRFCSWLADGRHPARRAFVQSRQVHCSRRRLVSTIANPYSRAFRVRDFIHRDLLFDLPDGWGRSLDWIAVRVGLSDVSGDRRRYWRFFILPSAACWPRPGFRSSKRACCSSR